MPVRKLIPIILLISLVVCGCSIRPATEGETTCAPTAATSPETEAKTALSADTAETTSASTEAEAPQGAGREKQTETAAAPAEPIAPRGAYEPLVFMYHLILDEPYSPYEGLFVRPSEFRGHLEALTELGYLFEFAENYRETYDYPTAIITLDDGYEDNYTEMFPLLREFGAKATVFVATSLVGTDGYLTEAQIKEMSDSGLVSIQSHTVAHVDLTYQSAEFIEQDTKDSIAYLEGLTGRPVRSMAYPAGSFDETVMSAVGKYVDFAYTTEPPSQRSVDSPLAIPRIRINRGTTKDAFLGMIEY